jgi:hypothetical protein
MPESRANDQQRRDCQVCEETRQVVPVAITNASRTIAPAFVPKAWWKSSRRGTYVGVLDTCVRFVKLNIMLMEKNHDVRNPITTVPMMAKGIILSGCGTSSAICVAQSRQAKAQLV